MALNRRISGRRDTSESPLGSHTSSFRLIAEGSIPDHIDNITDFENFKRLRRVYINLCDLPEPLFPDWISCCLEHIAKDIEGNTKEENHQNVRIGKLFEYFRDRYEVILLEEKNTVARREKINDSLLELLRSLLGKPCRLADEILTLSGFPLEGDE